MSAGEAGSAAGSGGSVASGGASADSDGSAASSLAASFLLSSANLAALSIRSSLDSITITSKLSFKSGFLDGLNGSPSEMGSRNAVFGSPGVASGSIQFEDPSGILANDLFSGASLVYVWLSTKSPPEPIAPENNLAVSPPELSSSKSASPSL